MYADGMGSVRSTQTAGENVRTTSIRVAGTWLWHTSWLGTTYNGIELETNTRTGPWSQLTQMSRVVWLRFHMIFYQCLRFEFTTEGSFHVRLSSKIIVDTTFCKTESKPVKQNQTKSKRHIPKPENPPSRSAQKQNMNNKQKYEPTKTTNPL